MRKQNLFRIVLVGSLVAGLSIVSSRVWADDTVQLKQQVQALQNQVDQLESQLTNDQQVTLVDPFTQMMMLRQQNIPYFLLGMPNAQYVNKWEFNPRMDMKQTDKQYIITMDIPGMDKDKINVEIKQGMLIVSGERRNETENKNNHYYQQERSFGSFMQTIPLPEDAQKDKINASYKNGVLTVTVARMSKEEKRSENQKIAVN